MNPWSRVTKQNPCPVCQKDSWCLIGEQSVLCMRVQSNRPKLLKSGETGWLHSLEKPRPTPPEKVSRAPRTQVDCRALMARWKSETSQPQLQALATTLGVQPWTLNEYGLCVAWSNEHRAWAFSMWDGLGHCIGIRLRSTSGAKWTVTGTHNGLFVPLINPQPTCLVCEGPTDTAAGLGLGYYTVGRPSCSGGAPMLNDLVRRTNIKRAIIIADNDDPGLNGAKLLMENIPVPSCVITLPCKDLREAVSAGIGRTAIDLLASQAVWHYRPR